MKAIVFLLGALLLMLTPTLLPAKGKAKAKKSQAPAATEAPSAPAPRDGKSAAAPAAVDNPVSHALGNFDFDTIRASAINYDSAGGVVMDGSVEIRSAQMDLDCAHLTKEKDNPVMTATGDPVKIHQKNSETDEMHAVCRHLTYDTDKKIYHLTGNPVINQKKGESETTTSADDVTILQDANGKNTVQLKSNRGPVTIINNKKPAAKAKAGAAKPATKVHHGEESLIPLPTMKNSSTDEQ
jgi:lipopolysaccharide transport protein LptA